MTVSVTASFSVRTNQCIIFFCASLARKGISKCFTGKEKEEISVCRNICRVTSAKLTMIMSCPQFERYICFIIYPNTPL